MRILAIHAKTFSYDIVKPAIEEPENINDDLKKEFENVLVLFTTIENSDDVDIVNNAIVEIDNLIKQIKPTEVLIYPYAHLSTDLASPVKAVEILNKLYDVASKSLQVPVYKAPFGWYKSFKLECYGHPLSELSRTITRGAVAQRKPIEKRYFIMTQDGALVKPEEFDYSNYPDLKILVDKEVYGKELEGGENRVNDYSAKFGFEWEPMSDHGHMRYNPPAVVLMDAVARYSWQVAKSLGIPVFRVMGTNMFNLRAKPVYEHAVLFGDRLYELEVD
ncbi:MAG: threonyl-tRNA synthetase editing domain-containing protein, partial [Desulfurococcaceae archaeon]